MTHIEWILQFTIFNPYFILYRACFEWGTPYRMTAWIAERTLHFYTYHCLTFGFIVSLSANIDSEKGLLLETVAYLLLPSFCAFFAYNLRFSHFLRQVCAFRSWLPGAWTALTAAVISSHACKHRQPFRKSVYSNATDSLVIICWPFQLLLT